MALQSTAALATVTLQAASSVITFSSIPNNYADLILVLRGAPADTSYAVLALRFNNDSGNSYTYVGMTGNGATVGSGSNGSLSYASLGQGYGLGPSTSSVFTTVVSIFDYATTNKHKTLVSRNNVADTGVEAQLARWANTSAISSISVLPSSGAGFAAGTTASLYGRIA
jgi:hypothetical protein